MHRLPISQYNFFSFPGPQIPPAPFPSLLFPSRLCMWLSTHSVRVPLHHLLHNRAQAPSARCHESKVRLARIKHAARVFGMILHTDVIRVILEFHNLHPLTPIVLSEEVEPGIVQLIHVRGVNLVPVPVALANDVDVSVQRAELAPLASGLEVRIVETQTHGAAHLSLVDLGHEDDDLVFGVAVEFLRGGLREMHDVAGEFDDGYLHAEADTQEGRVVLAGPLGCGDHALGAAVAETAGHENAVGALDFGPGRVVGGFIGCLFEELGVDPLEV